MRFRFAVYAVACLVASGCSADRPTTVSLSEADAVASTQSADEAAIEAIGNAINTALEAQGAAYRLYTAEVLGEVEAGITVIFNDHGNKRLPHDFVPADPRRGGRTNITYTIDNTESTNDGGLTAAQTSAAIDRAMATWNSVLCSTIPITKVDAPPVDIGLVEILLGQPGTGIIPADLNHSGWVPGGVLPNNVLAATFTFVFVNADGSPTDIDNNKAVDVAFREILYNNRFAWRINADVDIETVALHEAGHGLSQGHFGAAFVGDNGKLHFAPRAVMNAGYFGVQQTLLGSDSGGHCANWGSWPNN